MLRIILPRAEIPRDLDIVHCSEYGNAAFSTGRNYWKSEFPTGKSRSPDQFSRISQSECRKGDTTSDLRV